MRALKLITALSLGVALSACQSVPNSSSQVASVEPSAPQVEALLPRSLRVAEVNVRVPRGLSVSEANGYYPQADIVWRGDPPGDRHQQIADIFNTAFLRGTKGMTGETPVVLDVEVVRFHSITERTRQNLGGVHNMIFKLSVRAARTGQALIPTRRVEANLPALGGLQAVAAEAKGQTQKVRVTGYLSQVIQEQLRQAMGAAGQAGFASAGKKRGN